MNPKISVIMPMYNVEKYIGLAIQSLINQTFKDFEAIFVDDCGPGNSLAVAKSFSDPRINIIQNEKNLGATGSRNKGIELAKGKYIYFLDSDDAMLPNCLEILYNTAENNQADMVSSITSLWAADNEFQTLLNLKCNPHKMGTMDKVSNDLKTRIWEEYANHKIHCAVWLSLFKKNLFDGETSKIRFRNFAIADDDYFLSEILCATSKIIKIDKPVYVYRPREGSISKSSDIKRVEKYINSIMAGAEFLSNLLLPLTNDPNFINRVNLKVVERLFDVFIMDFYKSNSLATIQELNKALKESNKDNSEFFTLMILSFIQRNMLIKENNNLKNMLKSIKK